MTVEADDPTVGGSPDASQTFTLDVNDVNEAPTAVVFANTTTALDENTDTASRIKVADIVVTDDALGSETLTLSGADAAFFELDGSELYLMAGVMLELRGQAVLQRDGQCRRRTVGELARRQPDVHAHRQRRQRGADRGRLCQRDDARCDENNDTRRG